MEQLRKVLFREVQTVRINSAYTQPDMATDMLEVDQEKLGLLFQRGRNSARDVEPELRQFQKRSWKLGLSREKQANSSILTMPSEEISWTVLPCLIR